MRIAQNHLLNRGGSVVTAEELLSASAPRRPRLSLRLDFRTRNSSDLEKGETMIETPMAPTTPKLPVQLPLVKTKPGAPSAIEMLDPEKMDGLCKSQDSRRASLTSPLSSSTSTFLPTYSFCEEQPGADESPPHDPPGMMDTAESSHSTVPEPSSSEISCPP